MKTLDCETVESTYASIEEILRIERPLLEDILGNLDLDGACRRVPGKTGGELLFDTILKHARAAGPAFDQTCWFHLTRCHPRNSFSKGLLPLREALPFVWGFLLLLLPEKFPLEAWYEFAKDPPSVAYHRKLNDPTCHGPFALLPRDAGLGARESGIHDPFNGPSIVRDICSAFQEEHGVDLLHAYRQNTRPCVVKFRDKRTSPGQIGAALQYLYVLLHGARFPVGSQVDFDARGRAIPPDRILKVEFPERGKG